VLNDSIDIAGPILTSSTQIAANTLVESAMTKSQDHLMAISKRRRIPESVTNVLVGRGNRQVALSTTENRGAGFSEFGYATLVGRAEADGELAACIWRRPGIPREHLLSLFATASETVQRELQAINPSKANEIKALVGRATSELQCSSREALPEYRAVYAHIESLRIAGALSESILWAFARAQKVDEVSIALSLMCEVPVPVVEGAITHSQCDQLLVIARSIGLSFDTVKAILSMQTEGADRNGLNLNEVSLSYNKLRPETAKKTLQYYRLLARTALN
jgi:uncharacterized protein (DUF2336 family)